MLYLIKSATTEVKCWPSKMQRLEEQDIKSAISDPEVGSKVSPNY